MSRRVVYGMVAAAAVGLFVLGGASAQTGGKGAGKHEGHGDHSRHCAKVCAECMAICEVNFHHCAKLVTEGKKHHARPAQLSADCAVLCDAAAKLSARQSPFVGATCEACAKACEACAAECEKHGNDRVMHECAEKCRECARACRMMVQQAGHQHEAKEGSNR